MKYEDPIDMMIRSALGEYLTPYLRNLEFKRNKFLLRAIASMDREAQTDANIQKFVFRLQDEYLPIFAPTQIYLGGRWDDLRHKELGQLTDAGILQTRRSKSRGMDEEIRMINPDYRNMIDPIGTWQEEFKDYADETHLISPFSDHDQNVIVEWSKKVENYMTIDRRKFEQARNNDLDTDVNIIPNKVNYTSPPEIRNVNRKFRPYAATINHMVRNHKKIHSKEARERNTDEVKRSKRMFSQNDAKLQFNKNPSEVIGEPVLYVGIIGSSSKASTDPYWQLWRSPKFDESIPVKMGAGSGVNSHKIDEYSVGILGYLDEFDNQLGVQALAVLESSPLPLSIIRQQRKYVVSDIRTEVAAIKKMNKAVSQLHNDIEVISGEERKYVRKLMKRLNQANTLLAAREHLRDFQEQHPELAWIAESAIKWLN